MMHVNLRISTTRGLEQYMQMKASFKYYLALMDLVETLNCRSCDKLKIVLHACYVPGVVRNLGRTVSLQPVSF